MKNFIHYCWNFIIFLKKIEKTSIDYQLCVWWSRHMVTWPFTFNCKKIQVQEEKDQNKNGLGQMGSPTMYKKSN
jgi:hypothetical protein